MNSELTFQLLTNEHIQEIALLGQQLNPKLTIEEVTAYQEEMFRMPTYLCFGVFMDEKLVGISSGWITVRFYSGKQLEVDNVIIDGNNSQKASARSSSLSLKNGQSNKAVKPSN